VSAIHLSRRAFLTRTAGAGVAAFAAASAGAMFPGGQARGGEATSRPPNLVLIVIDDLGWTDLCCYGNTFIETPAIDRLAADAALDGVSLVPLLKSTGGLQREALYWHFPTCSYDRHPMGAVRRGDFKLIERYETERALVHVWEAKK